MTRQINTGSNPAYLTLVQNYSTFARFPTPEASTLGDLAYAQDTGITYVSEGGAWIAISGVGNAFNVVKTAIAYTARFNDLVDGDPTGASFDVTLPAASSVSGSSGNAIIVKNGATSPNTIGVVAAGSDTIDGVLSRLDLDVFNTVYLVSDGVSNWLLVVIPQENNTVYATDFPGADLGQKINAADAALGTAPGTIVVPPGGSIAANTIITKITLSAGHDIHFGAGYYTTDFNDPSTWMISVKGQNRIYGDGWNTVIEQPRSMNMILPFAAETGTDGNDDVEIRDLQIVTPHNPTPSGGGQQCIGTWNSKRWRISNIWFNNCYAIRCNLGGASAVGKFSDECRVENCLFDDTLLLDSVFSCTSINSRSFQILGNIFINGNIDIEPNAGTDLDDDWVVADNISYGGEILAQQSKGGLVSNNIMDGLGTKIGAIEVQNSQDVQVSDNVIRFYSAATSQAISVLNSTRTIVRDNLIHNCAANPETPPPPVTTGGSINIQNSTYTFVTGNVMTNSGPVATWSAIQEVDALSDFTYVWDNYLGANFSNTGFTTPIIFLQGANSKQWFNILIDEMVGSGFTAQAGTLTLTGNTSRQFVIDSITDGFAFIFGGGGEFFRIGVDAIYSPSGILTSGRENFPWPGSYSKWYSTTLGAQLPAAGTITPTNGLHHVVGATPITTIDPSNIPTNGDVFLTLIADGGTITLNTGGNIAAATTIPQNTMRTFVWDGTNWYPQA